MGHFVGYPALPVSVMMRRALQLVAEGVRRELGAEAIGIELVSGIAETHAFVFAHEQATLTARRLDPGGADKRQTWRCEVEGERGRAAVFELTVESRSGHAATLVGAVESRLTGS